MLLYQFRDHHKSTVCRLRYSDRSHAFEKCVASLSSSSCSLLLMAAEPFTPPFKSSASEVIKLEAVYRQEILKYLIAFFFFLAQGRQASALHTTCRKDTCPCLTDMEQGIAKLETSVTKTPFNPHQAHFFLLVLAISFQLLFIFFSFSLSNYNKTQKRAHYYCAQGDSLLYLESKQCTNYTWTFFPLPSNRVYNLELCRL